MQRIKTQEQKKKRKSGFGRNSYLFVILELRKND